MTLRRVAFEGPINFRDLGGYPVEGGGHVRWGRLYRSDSLHTITPDDVPMLRELGVRTAIDFRSSDEIDRLGIGPLGEVSVRHVHCPTFDGARTEEPPMFEGKTAAEFYALMMDRGAGAYVAALESLTEPGALPSVFFCVAGKDRTGCFAALVLGLLGVSNDDIVLDYALTQEIVPILTARRLERDGPEVDAERWKHIPPDLREARVHVMEELVGIMHERWGSWEGYAGAAGIGTEVVARLREELLGGGAQ
ncbi:MAG: tyrosine-protein phosphatase [Acidimicrobiia bacterium]